VVAAEQADSDLVRRVAGGDQEAFLELYDRFATQVHALTTHILRDSMLAEEATQDTFLKVWGRARQYVPERGEFDVWLLTIARRTALDRLRLEGRRPLLSDGHEPDAIWEALADTTRDAGEARWRSMHFAVQSLSEVQRQVIELAFYQGLSQSEIAAELGWPLGTVKTRTRAAVQALRLVWGAEDGKQSEDSKRGVLGRRAKK
jgi:RNA polymerase sigma-70 factor (ECF subfamily)